jgi:NDP-sugar pyrophosphorylase family protein
LPFHINCGIYVVSPDVLGLVPKDEFFDMPDLIGVAVKTGHTVFGYPIREEWVAIENLGDLTEQSGTSS